MPWEGQISFTANVGSSLLDNPVLRLFDCRDFESNRAVLLRTKGERERERTAVPNHRPMRNVNA